MTVGRSDDLDAGPVPVIGLAGGIGAGKSAVAAALARLGCTVSDSDADVRVLLADAEIKGLLCAWWGEGVVDASGALDRGAVARIVFRDPAQRARLEGLLHPRLHAMRAERFAAGSAAVAHVIDAPLLYEAGVVSECHAVLFVDAPRRVRLERVARTRGWDEAELARREAAQWPVERKRALADAVVVNDGSSESSTGTDLAGKEGLGGPIDRRIDEAFRRCLAVARARLAAGEHAPVA